MDSRRRHILLLDKKPKRSAGATRVGGFFIGWNMRLRLTEARAFYFREA
jgi:hypothetical protein